MITYRKDDLKHDPRAQLGTLIMPGYSPNMAPSDHHLFKSTQHGLSDQHFQNVTMVKIGWFNSFDRSRVLLLPCYPVAATTLAEDC
ncbi:hypothetical protein M514_05760 [Trichuris suis]|uniref:Uncharacterized protein n=1 Tax=Trichuris suis TaxID=68888 RepID=A0A085NA65_9BILA|nr:hypothetical protein M513_05760 [Trichuris suis]KFD66361.1 hypothetical protein M514_05760 [Trichuris suis]